MTGVLVTAVRKQREMKADTLVAFSLVKPSWKLPYTHAQNVLGGSKPS